jgi:cell division protein FtsB
VLRNLMLNLVPFYRFAFRSLDPVREWTFTGLGSVVSQVFRIAGTWFHRMRRILATLCIAILAVAAGYKVVYGANGAIVYKQKRAEYQRLQQEIIDEQQRHQELQDHVRALQTDPKAIEKEAREQLGYVRPGERVLVQRQPRPDVRATPDVAQNQSITH